MGMEHNRETIELGLALAKSARPAALFADAGGSIRFWNAGAESLFGYSASEAVGQRADLIVPASMREAHWSGFNRAFASPFWRGSQDWGGVPALHRNGEQIAVEVFLFPVERPEGGLAGVVALFRNPI